MANQYQKHQLNSFSNFASPNGIMSGIKLEVIFNKLEFKWFGKSNYE
jgi:hypothetical protein